MIPDKEAGAQPSIMQGSRSDGMGAPTKTRLASEPAATR